EKSFARAVELDPDNAPAHMALAEEAYCRADRKGMLAHMHEVFLRRPTGDNGRNRSRYGQDDEGSISKLGQWAVELAADPEIASYLSGTEAGEHAADYRLML